MTEIQFSPEEPDVDCSPEADVVGNESRAFIFPRGFATFCDAAGAVALDVHFDEGVIWCLSEDGEWFEPFAKPRLRAVNNP